MPIINVTLVEGRSDEVIEAFMKKAAHLASEELDAPLTSVRVIVQQVPPNHFAVGDTLKSEQS